MLRVRDVPEPSGDARSPEDIAAVDERLGFDQRVADPEDIAMVRAVLGDVV